MYILRSETTGQLYVGQTNDLVRRLAQHNDPNVKSYTAKRGPWMLAHAEGHEARADAMARERYLKSPAGSREKKKLTGA